MRTRTICLALLITALSATGAPASDRDDLLASFRQPPREYSPVPIWWWSGGRIEKDRLDWQMERMVEGHVYNAIVLNLDPSSDYPNYFSREWWRLMDSTVEKAEKLGTGIWFYDHLGFARSDVHEDLMLATPAFRAESLDRLEEDAVAGEEVTLRVPPGSRLVAAGACSFRDDSSLGPMTDLIGSVKDGVLSWRPSDGRWKVMLFHARPADFDFSNSEAAGALISSVHGEYERRYGRYLGNTIPGSFQDEFPALPRWSQQFLDQFRANKGYDLTPHLPALFDDCGPGTWKYRFDYRDVMSGLCEDAFFKPCFEWHRNHGMICGTDQRVRDADPVGAQKSYIDYFRTMRWYDAPGQDQNGDPKIRSSIAHLYGRPRVWQEGFHSTGWGQTLEDLTALVNSFFVRGANLYNPHAWYYSTAGSWWEFAPPCTSFRQPYWRHYRYFADYVARMSYILSQGTHVCDIAVLYPSTTIQADMTIDGKVSPSSQATDETFWATLGMLDDDSRDYDWIDEPSLQNAACNDGRLRAGSEGYRVLILPRASCIRTASARKVREFAESGGIVITVGDMPNGSAENGKDDPAIGKLFGELRSSGRLHALKDADSLTGLLGTLLPRDASPGVRVLHRLASGLHFYFIVRGETDPERVVLSAKGLPEIWDPYTGETHPVHDCRITDAGTEVSLDFDLSPAYFIVIDPSDSLREAVEGEAPSEPSAVTAQTELRPPTKIPLDGEWDFRLEPTMDNRWGDFRLPEPRRQESSGHQAEDFMPVETREFRYADDPGNEGLSKGWNRAEFDDSAWQKVVCTHGPYWHASDWIETSGPADFAKAQAPESWAAGSAEWLPVVFSRSFGIEKDPVFSGVRFIPEKEQVYFSGRKMTLMKDRPQGGSQYGPKSRVPAEFTDLGAGKSWAVRYLSTYAYSPEARRTAMEIGGRCARRVWLNGQLVLDQQSDAVPISLVPVTLNAGWNRILVKVAQSSPGAVRVSFDFNDVPDGSGAARWIWAKEPIGTAYFRKTVDLPDRPITAHVNIAGDNVYDLYVNDRHIANKVRLSADYWRSGDSYDLPLRKGRNSILVQATNSGGPGGFILWGTALVPSGDRIPIVTDESWRAYSVLPGKPEDPVLLGTLSESRWRTIRWGVDPVEQALGPRMPLRDAPGTVYDPDPSAISQGWYRFRLPPGVKSFRLPTEVPCEVYVDGQAVLMESDGRVNLPSPGGICAIRAEQRPGFRGGAVFHGPVEFDCGPGRITLGSWHEKGLPSYSGIGVYSRTIELAAEDTDKPMVLDLGAVRGTAEVSVNGQTAGVRIWKPYRFDISSLVKPGSNRLEILVTNTLGPHYSVGIPTPYVFPGQEVSGILGPVTLSVQR